MLTGLRRSEHCERPYACTKPSTSMATEAPRSQGRSGPRMRAAPAVPAAARNVPTGRQQLAAAARLPIAAMDDNTGPRVCATSSILHTAEAGALEP